jgi:hypothetical protein
MIPEIIPDTATIDMIRTGFNLTEIEPEANKKEIENLKKIPEL